MAFRVMPQPNRFFRPDVGAFPAAPVSRAARGCTIPTWPWRADRVASKASTGLPVGELATIMDLSVPGGAGDVPALSVSGVPGGWRGAMARSCAYGASPAVSRG